MPETFLLLLCAGVMLASAIPNPREVTRHWLRLCGIIAIAALALSWFFASRRDPAIARFDNYRFAIIMILIGLQLVFVRTNLRAYGRVFSLLSFVWCIPLAATLLTRPAPVPIGASVIGCAGIAAMTGVVLMEMLLGHAHRAAADTTIVPLRRMNLVFMAILGLRMFFGLCAVLMEPRWRVQMFWTNDGWLVGTRWVVGLLVPCIFVYMIHDRIRRPSAQSATGILYVMGVLVFIGEIVALYLTRKTGLPF